MATLKNSARRLAIAGGFALAVAAAPAVAAFTLPSTGPAPAVAACPPGEVVNPATGQCAPGPVNTNPGEIAFSTPVIRTACPRCRASLAQARTPVSA